MTAYNPAILQSAISDTNGEPEVPVAWVRDNLDKIRLIDIREPHELSGPLGKIDGAENIPLLTLIGQASRLDTDTPVVLICRSGRRSSIAAGALRQAGVAVVASAEGGMLAWNSDVLGKHDIKDSEKRANAANLSEATYNTNGLPEVSAQWVANNLGRFKLIDVRNPSELRANGFVPQAENRPLELFMSEVSGYDRDMPIVVMCASGGRSGRVVHAMAAAGFTNVASMEGGMFGWSAYGLPHA